MMEISLVAVAAADVREVMVNPTPGLATAIKDPIELAPALPFREDLVSENLVFAVTEELATAMVPATKVACPILALTPDLIVIPLPMVPMEILPLVNVMPPEVSVSVPEDNNKLPEVSVALPEVSTRFPLVRVALPEVRARFPEEIVNVPVVNVRPPAPLGVNVNPTAALDPVPVKTLPEPRVIAVAAVPVWKVVAVTVVNVLETDPSVVQVADPAETAASANTFWFVLSIQSWPRG
jgi:hypothetical protein